ncbi:hypothetical protein BDP27DRAFT_1425021 [Rhodocollybia butyracea]|uniref:F-box domain-containing protein n=1 Tax=Rhodocollybia butyracea TaxID=206335 RepID=A0A9P5U3R7_9AGAR|nr:hypothetical protein BDP27DRAFT_1425021 [Rhodocollybia butyracea]
MSLCSRNTFIPRVLVDSPGLYNKLRTESGPASVRPGEVASVLLDIERDIEDYDAEISRLRRDKKCSKQYASLLQSLNSPIRKIPDEILQQIFDDCCDMNCFRVVDLGCRLPLSESASQVLRSKPTMAITSVCSRWRKNALSMPVLWS